MKVALDTNVLAYAAGLDDAARRDVARSMIDAMGARRLVLPQQVAGEFYNVMRRKGAHEPAEAARIVRGWTELLGLAPSSAADFDEALALATLRRLQIWDALILVTAASAGCALLLSEDMQDGFVYRGVTVADPFRERPHPLLASLLDTLPGAPE